MHLHKSTWVVVIGASFLVGCGASGDNGGTPDGGKGPSGSSSGGGNSSSGAGGSSGGGSNSSGSGGSSGSASSSGSGSGGTVDGGWQGDGSVSTNAIEVYQTSRSAGAGMMPEHMKDLGPLTPGGASSGKTTITIDAKTTRQTIVGFGAAITEAVASVVSGLPMAQQQEIWNAYFASTGSGYTLTRTHIGSCDFALSQYSYDDSSSPDPMLTKFSTAHDDTLLIPALKSAMTASGNTLKILASPWSAPGWMKDNGLMKGNGSDGSLLSQYYGAYASYLSKYLLDYKNKGVKVWAITPQNEGLGVGGSREGMQWSPGAMNTFIGTNLGPQLKTDHVDDTKIFIYDHNKGPAGSDMVTWANTIAKDAKSGPFVTGTAVHWYGATDQTYDDGLDALHAVDPSKSILFDEGTADELGDTGFGKSSASFQYSWMSDDFYWKKDDWDWGYWFPPGGNRGDHVVYEPAYRYIRDIISGLNHWYVGFIDWNGVLNRDGGPGHINNPVPAAIMVDTTKNTLYYSPLFYAMQHFSKFIRPDAHVLTTSVNLAASVKPTDYDGMPTQDGHALMAAAAQNADGSTAVEVFNETNAAIDYAIVVGAVTVTNTIPSQSLQTVVFK